MTAYEIPLRAEAQTFVITLGGASRRLTTRWNDATAAWLLEIATPDGIPILTGIPLVPGADLLGQHQHLELGGQIWVQSLSDANRVPGLNDLGTDGLVFYVTP